MSIQQEQQNYTINIVGRHRAIVLDTLDSSEDYLLISINSIQEKHHKFQNPHLKGLLYLDFDDIEPSAIKQGSKCTAMTFEQAQTIKDFIDSYLQDNPSVKTIFVHCAAGVSRSAAVGFVLTRYLNNQDDKGLFEQGKYSPNKWVYKLMCRAFGIQFNSTEFKRNRKISQTKCLEGLYMQPDGSIKLSDLLNTN